MGLVELLLGKANPVSQFVAQNRNAIRGAGAGFGSATNIGDGFGAAARGAAVGAPLDDAFATTEKERMAREQQLQTAIANIRDKYQRPDIADMMETGGLDVQSGWNAVLKGRESSTDDLSGTSQGRAKLADQYGLSGDAAQAYILTGKLPGANDSSKYGNNPIYARDENGNYIAVQPGSDGSTNVMQFPDGFRPDPGALNSDRAAGTAYGSAQGAMQFNLPAAKQNVEAELQNIQALKADTAGIEETFGKVAGVWPQQWSPTIPGSKRADYATRLEQVQGQNFLQAFTTLKGAGAITEQEGAKAQAALARLSQNQSKEAYLQSLDDLEKILTVGYQRMSGQAGAGAYQSGTGQQPGGQTSSGLSWSIEP